MKSIFYCNACCTCICLEVNQSHECPSPNKDEMPWRLQIAMQFFSDHMPLYGNESVREQHSLLALQWADTLIETHYKTLKERGIE